jgi:hypothetical protein
MVVPYPTGAGIRYYRPYHGWFGTTQDYKLQDLEWKYAILQQTRSNSMPVSLSYYGNMVIEATEKKTSALRKNTSLFTVSRILHNSS